MIRMRQLQRRGWMLNSVRWQRGMMLLVVWLAVMPASASVSMFLKLAGVEGESSDTSHKGQIDILAWSWGMSNFTNSTRGSQADLQDLSIYKWLDKTSPRLWEAACKGRTLTNAVLTVSSPVTGQDLYRIEMTGVQVRSVSTGGSGGEDRLTESVTLRFATYKMDYLQANPDGTTEKPIGVFWDTAAATGDSFTAEPLRTTNFVASLSFTAGSSWAGMSWSSVPGKQYRVSFAESLAQPFVPFATYPAGGAQTMSILIPISKAKEFFRVEELSE
ncbi:MAG TPA: type VI secretion system tube protein Hcp [Clostridia bacterium]|nr:type VI secretion system tube protein Hcp [Clostridia bacterium]